MPWEKDQEREDTPLRLSGISARLALGTIVAALALVFVGGAGAARYLVLYKKHNVPGNAARELARAGGTLVASYDEIGVAVVDSDDPDFLSRLQGDGRVKGAAGSDDLDDLDDETTEFDDDWDGPRKGRLPNIPASGVETFESLQWNMGLIRAREAQAVSGGSPAVVVGVIDAGIDFDHADLNDNFDHENSVSCVGGVARQVPAEYDDVLSGHGTHVAGVIAAESNGVGVVGVAPHVKIASIKAAVRVGMRDIFTPEAVVCSLVWAGARHLDVANNSYSVDKADVADPLDFYCRSDPGDSIAISAVQRAVRYARRNGVTVVASAGNSNLDLANPPLGNECVRMPSELAGVVTVGAVGPNGQKASYSNYGKRVIDLAAPGGEVPPIAPPPSGLIASTWPAETGLFTSTTMCDPKPPVTSPPTPCPAPGTMAGTTYYRFAAGTSQAAAHVSGVAALVVSRYGSYRHSWRRGKMRPGYVEAVLERTAVELSCPPDPTTCQADGHRTNWYGHGRVDALRAVLRDPSA